MLWINLIAALSFVAGFATGWRAIRRRRLPARVEGVVLKWEENPPPAFLYDPLGCLAITAHACAVIALSILLVWSVNRSASSPVSLVFQSPADQWLESHLGIVDAQSRWLSFVTGALAAGIGAFTFGGEVSFPLVRRAARPVLVQWSDQGIFHGSVGVSWEQVARWSVDRSQRLIGLYTGGPRPTLASVLHPATEEGFVAALELLDQRAPLAKGDWEAGISRDRLIRMAGLLAGTLAVVLIALLLSSIIAEWVWFAYGVGILVLEGLGLLLARA